jgi:hypothetical protein
VDGIPAAMPALAFAAALQKRAGQAALTWQGAAGLRLEGPAAAAGAATVATREERAGAYLWAAVRQVMDAGVDPETALRSVALRFRDRVRRAEALAGRHLSDLPDDERARLWAEAEAPTQ